jgi:hypothetical protein
MTDDRMTAPKGHPNSSCHPVILLHLLPWHVGHPWYFLIAGSPEHSPPRFLHAPANRPYRKPKEKAMSIACHASKVCRGCQNIIFSPVCAVFLTVPLCELYDHSQLHHAPGRCVQIAVSRDMTQRRRQLYVYMFKPFTPCAAVVSHMRVAHMPRQINIVYQGSPVVSLCILTGIPVARLSQLHSQHISLVIRSIASKSKSVREPKEVSIVSKTDQDSGHGQ